MPIDHNTARRAALLPKGARVFVFPDDDRPRLGTVVTCGHKQATVRTDYDQRNHLFVAAEVKPLAGLAAARAIKEREAGR